MTPIKPIPNSSILRRIAPMLIAIPSLIPTLQAIEIIKDSTDSTGISITGSWAASSAVYGYHGSNYLHDDNTGKGSKSVTYTPSITQAGAYQVYARWTESWDRASSVRYTIQHTGGPSIAYADQRTNGNSWYLLGTYQFAAGTAGNVTVSNIGTSSYVVADAIRFVSVDAVATAVILDNSAPSGVTTVGSWTASTAAAGHFQGTNYWHDGNIDKGTKSVRFNPTIAVTSNHHVYIKSPANIGYSKKTPVTINHNRGSTTVEVDQRINTGRWTYLGCYGFTAGTTGNVVISTTGTAGHVIVDAVKFVPTTEIIQDTQDTAGVTLTGTWTAGISSHGFYGANYLSDGNTGTGKSVRFTPTIPQSGSYEIFTRSNTGNGRASNTPFEINHAGGTTTTTVNQQQNGGRWHSLGVHPFNAGTTGNVLISNAGADGYVIADAMRFVPQIVLDNSASSGVTINGTWTTATTPAGYIGADYRHDGNAGKGSRTARFSPTIAEAGRYDVFARWTAGSDRATNARYYISSAGGTTLMEVDQRTRGGEWVFLGNYPFHSGTSGSVLVSNAGTSGIVVADAIRLAPREYQPDRVSVATPAYASTISGNTWVQVVAPGFTSITAKCWQAGSGWGSDSTVTTMDLDSGGNASFVFPAASYPHGPITLRITGTKGSFTDTCYLQLYNNSGTPWKQGAPAGAPAAAAGAGLTNLAYVDDFNSMPSISSYGIGATYSAHKPGGGDFSEIPFGDPTGDANPFSQVGSYLRIRADANKDTTGLISSLRSDGTGFLANCPAYFECRFLASSASGTWPTFWLLTYNGTFTGVPVDELDIIEAYGGEEPNDAKTPRRYSVTNHTWNQTGIPAAQKIAKSVDMTAFASGSGWMYTPHTYGCLVTTTDTIYYLDDVEVGRHQTSPVSKTDPFFFLANLAVGGLSGWPVDLSRYDGISDMYIDYVRVFTAP